MLLLNFLKNKNTKIKHKDGFTKPTKDSKRYN